MPRAALPSKRVKPRDPVSKPLILYVYPLRKGWTWEARSRNGFAMGKSIGMLPSEEAAEKKGLGEHRNVAEVRYGKPPSAR